MPTDRLSKDVIHARNVLACLVKVRPNDSEAIAAARGGLAAAHIARSIAQNAAALDAAQRARLAALLTPADPGTRAAALHPDRRATNGGSR